MATIYLVEDDTTTQMYLKAVLRTGGHEVIGLATDFDEAKAGIASLKPDLCLIDVHLTSSSGIDVAEYVLERLGTPLVMMSADNHPTLPVPFVHKPISMSKLFATIDKALERK
jgi:DNA-binding response OmpR family regulator